MNQFCFPNRLKATKRPVQLSYGSSLSKKIQILFESSFLETFSFFCFLSLLETSHVSYRSSVNDQLQLQSNETQ